LTQSKIDNTLTVVNEIKNLSNDLITQLGYNGTGHTAYNDTVQVMNMLAVLTAMVGNITDIDYIDLVLGTNAVALPQQPTNISVEYVMDNITGSYSRVDHYDGTTQSWLVYNPANPINNTLTNMTTSEVYWIYVNVTSVRLYIK
jgi:hypothetical protein